MRVVARLRIIASFYRAFIRPWAKSTPTLGKFSVRLKIEEEKKLSCLVHEYFWVEFYVNWKFINKTE